MSKRKYAEMKDMAILAAYVLESSEEDELDDASIPKKCNVWTKNWVARRDTEGFFGKLMDELRSEEPELYRNFIRMSSDQFGHLLGLVKPHIEKSDTIMRTSISAAERLAVTLRYLATGDNFNSLRFLFRIPQPTIMAIIPEVLDAIYKVLVDDYIKIPSNEAGWEEVENRFNNVLQFPNCLGAVDGKHVVLVAPANSGSTFYNYKGTHSIVLMGVADADYKFLYVDAGRNGRFSDGGVFNRCTFGQALDTNQLHLPSPKALPGRETPVPYVLVADDAFAMRPNVMKPFAQRALTMPQRVFNYRLSRARRIIENVFGIMSARFRVLRKPIHLNPEKAKKVVLACCVLHNFLLTTNKALYVPPNSFDSYDEVGNLTRPGEWRTEEASGTMQPLEAARTRSVNAKELQQEFMHYFIDEGELSWQYDHV